MAGGTAGLTLFTDNIRTWLQDAVMAHYLRESERTFLARLQSYAKHVLVYEDPFWQHKALDLLPVSSLYQKAQEASDRSREGGQDGIHEKDCLLLEFLAWFGTFFSWMDKPVCVECGTKTELQGHVPPTADEKKWWVGVVEGYRCPKCGNDERFPRYNHPGKLLETRCGRCGEFANCKALFCRSLGFEVRYVIDWTDHVWIEVYSEAQKRWIHCDGGKCDDNFLYETWWGKKFTYIMAFSRDEVVDVTWRYSLKQDEVRQRRMLVSEEWLCRTLANLNEERHRKLSPDRCQVLMKRFARELAEFLSVSKGRLLGTAAWRRIRGMPESEHIAYIFTPTDEEIRTKSLRLQYCCATDKYYRGGKPTDLGGWEAGASVVKSMFRNIEHDWETVRNYLGCRGVKEADLRPLRTGNCFLARLQGSPTGLIAWEVDLTTSGLVIDSVSIVIRSTTFAGGEVSWKLTGNQGCQNLSFSDDQEVITTCLSGSQTLRLTVNLCGGKGEDAWQHAQLFAQPIKSDDYFPLDITVSLQRT